MKKVLIIPDIEGWAVDNMADNIIKALSDEFEFTKVIAENFPQHGELEKYVNDEYDKYDIIYMMLPGYITPEMKLDKIITTFHGGPGIEGQADAIDRHRQNDLHISYVSNQVKYRVTEKELKSNRKIWAPIQGTTDKEIDMPNTYKEQNIVPEDVIKYDIEREARQIIKQGRVRINLKIWRKGYGLKNLKYLTPHGINPEEYKFVDVKKSGFTCGYAGWAKYILGGQPDHRRIDWIFRVHSQLKMNVHFAAGLHKHAAYDTHILKLRYNRFPEIKIWNLEKHEMSKFYSGLDCYLVPDKYAGGPMPVLEAGLLAVPPVCSDAGLCGDIIEHMKTGYVYKKDDPRDFFMGVKFMKENHEKRIEMGNNLRKYILENRTWEAVAHYWRDFLNRRTI